MRRLAPALDGRLTRRAIVHSPHTWNATAATFVMFAISDFVVALTAPGQFHTGRLYVLATCIALIGITIGVTRPPERGTLGSHLLVIAVYGGVSAAVYAHAPQGSGPLVTGMFIPVLAALWLVERRHAAAHYVAASALMLTAALTGGNDVQTLVAVLCFLPAGALLLVATWLVLDAVDAQADALETLALRDPLTGVGNQRLRDSELDAELTRHRSAGRPFAIVDVSLRDFQELNDRVGRAAGDTVLTALAGILTARSSAGATVARLDGDRFSVLLPSTDAAGAARFVDAIREAMPAQAGHQALVLISGIATYPADGTRADQLVIAAADRWRSDSGAPTTGRADGSDSPWTLVMTGLELAPRPDLPRRVNRWDLASDMLIWRAIGGAFLAYAAIISAAQLITGELAGSGFVPAVAATTLCAGWLLASRPPKIGTWRNHVAIASAYVLPFGAMLAAAPNASWAVSTAFLAPLLTVVRLTDRKQIAVHLAMPPILCLGLAASGQVDQASVVACLALSVNTWVLGVCTAVVFEAAETQWQEIEGLVLRDPLTGAGNRDLLAQRLAEELPRHDQLQMSLAFLELDLVGFQDLIRRDGRGAANHVLRDTALVISGVVGPTATVSRVGGSTFRILLPLTDLDDISPERTEDLLTELRHAIASTSRRDRHVLPRIGVAMYPEDARDALTLEAVAASRRRADDPYRHELPIADVQVRGRANVA